MGPFGMVGTCYINYCDMYTCIEIFRKGDQKKKKREITGQTLVTLPASEDDK